MEGHDNAGEDDTQAELDYLTPAFIGSVVDSGMYVC